MSESDGVIYSESWGKTVNLELSNQLNFLKSRDENKYILIRMRAKITYYPQSLTEKLLVEYVL